MGTEHEEHSFLMIKDKNLSQIKADLIHAFLCVCHLLLLAHKIFSYRCCRLLRQLLTGLADLNHGDFNH